MGMQGLSRAERRGNQQIDRALADGPLQTGDNEAAVKALERMLRLAGFDPGKLDPRFTDRTARALANFQTAVGLPATGQLDERSFARLRALQGRIRDHGDDYMTIGQKSGALKRHEAQLKGLGYDAGKVDGIYDRDTARAVGHFKRDQRELDSKNGNGFAGPMTRSLRKETRRLDHAPERRRVREGHKKHRRLDALTARQANGLNADGTRGIAEGDRGRAVKNVQAHLRAAGFDPKHANGVFDERTAGALRAFQRESGLPETGRVTPGTWRKLKRSMMLAGGAADPAQRVGERSKAVERSERLLKRLGYNPGKVDGLFTEQTRNASRAFEKKHKGNGNSGAIGEHQLDAMKRALKRKLEGNKGIRGVGHFGGSNHDKLMYAWRVARRMGLTITSYNTGTHAPGSYHYQNRAIDVAGSPSAMARFYRFFDGKRPTELFYDPIGGIKNGVNIGPIGGHSDHVHIAF